MSLPIDPERALRAIRRQLAADDSVSEGETPSLAGMDNLLADLMVLHLAFDAYAQWLNAQGRRITEPHAKKAVTVLQRHDRQLAQMMDGPLKAIVDRPDARTLQPSWRKATQGSRLSQIKHRAHFFSRLLRWMKTRRAAANDLITEAKARQQVVRLYTITDAETPEETVSQLARLPSASGSQQLREWVRTAAKFMSVEVSPTEETLADAETAAAIADKLKKVDIQLASADPMSEEAAELDEQRGEILADLDELSDNSMDPQTVRAAAVTATVTQPKSKVVEEMGLDPEKADFLMTRGKVQLAAGAGSGKTYALTAAVKHYVEEVGVPPQRIMVTTFTKAATAEMQERLGKLGVTDARVGTTHNISGGIIRDYRPHLKEAMRGAHDGRADKLYRMAMKQVTLSAGGGGRFADDRTAGPRKQYTRYYDTPVGMWFNLGVPMEIAKVSPYGKVTKRKVGTKQLKLITDNWSTSGIDPATAWAKHRPTEIDPEEGIGLMALAAATYGAYEWLKGNDPQFSPCMDFGDWLKEAVDIVETNPTARKRLQDWFRVVIVDEAQDLNGLQWRLFDAIGEDSITYAVIGDDKQAIYEWRGAVPQEFQDKRDKGFTTKLLTTNYRSAGAIVQAGNRLIAHNEDRQIPMVCQARPGREEQGSLICWRPEDHQAGAKRVATEINDSLNSGEGLSPNDFGVIVRNNAEAEAFAMSLASRGIPFRGKNVGKFFNKPHVRGILAWLRIATAQDTGPSLNATIEEAARYPTFGLGKKFFEKLAERSRSSRKSYFEVLTVDVLVGGYQIYGGFRDFDMRIERMAQQLVDIREKAADADVLTALRACLEIQGSDATLRDFIIDQIGPEDLESDDFEGVEPSDEDIERAVDAMIRPLLDLAGVKRFNLDADRYIGFIERMRNKTGQSKKKEKDEDQSPAVRIDTCHQWKGLEAKHVFVSMSGGVFPFWGDQRSFDAGDRTALDSERRLAYVAITRGKESVTVLCPEINYRGKDADVSQFIAEACIPMEGADDSGGGMGKAANWMKYNEDFDDGVWGSDAYDPLSLEAACLEDMRGDW